MVDPEQVIREGGFKAACEKLNYHATKFTCIVGGKEYVIDSYITGLAGSTDSPFDISEYQFYLKENYGFRLEFLGLTLVSLRKKADGWAINLVGQRLTDNDQLEEVDRWIYGNLEVF